MSAESISDIIKLRNGARDILKLETLVLQGLQFDLVVYEPYRCADAMLQVRLNSFFLSRCQDACCTPMC
jgi:hypothetical protein